MSKPKKTKTPKTINAKEIKAWLRGIQEFQPKDWTPTAEQWATIRDKIFSLEEVETGSYQSEQQYEQEVVQQQETVYAPVRILGKAPDFAGQQPQQPQREGVLAVPTPVTETGVMQVRNITTEGEYKSPF